MMARTNKGKNRQRQKQTTARTCNGENKQLQKKQIPFGDDNQRSDGKNKQRLRTERDGITIGKVHAPTLLLS
jgi:hypothetical protein